MLNCLVRIGFWSTNMSISTENNGTVANGHSKVNHVIAEEPSSKKPYKRQLVWRNIGLMTVLHSLALFGIYHYFVTAKFYTLLFTNFTTVLFGTIITLWMQIFNYLS